MYRHNFFNSDPFFNFPNMDPHFGQMMNDPFLTRQTGHPSIEGGQMNHSNALTPFGAFGGMPDIFGNMNAMMRQMQSQMMQMQNQTVHGMPDPNGNGHFYSSSSFYSFDNRNGGEPHVYQAQSSTLTAPGGIRETRKAEKDSRSGEEKMAIGHHIGDRGHVREKRRNRRTNEHDEQEDLYGIDHDELDDFHKEWSDKTRRVNRHQGIEHRRNRHAPDRRAITNGRRH